MEDNKRYNYTEVSMETVESDIDEYIIPELQEACKILWSKNIFTFMCSNREDQNMAYILYLTLSDENNKILESLKKKYPNNFTYSEFRGCNSLFMADTTGMSEKEISDKFVKMAEMFKLQDVQSDYYETMESYLIKCGCFEEVENAEQDSLPVLDFESEDLDFNSYLSGLFRSKTIKVFDKSKMTMSFEDYVKSNGDEDKTDFVLGRVYSSPYFYKKHLDFLEKESESFSESDM